VEFWRLSVGTIHIRLVKTVCGVSIFTIEGVLAEAHVLLSVAHEHTSAPTDIQSLVATSLSWLRMFPSIHIAVTCTNTGWCRPFQKDLNMRSVTHLDDVTHQHRPMPTVPKDDVKRSAAVCLQGWTVKATEDMP
jgi:hypothetical protein